MPQLPIRKMTGRIHSAPFAGIAVGAMLLSGCAVLGGGSMPLDTFDLVSPNVQNAEPVRRGTQILIGEPGADQALDSSNIVVRTGSFAIEYLSGAQWSDRLTRLVQRRLSEAFESSGRFGGVGLPGQGLAIDYQVLTSLQRFEIDATRNRADVAIEAKLVNDRNGVVVASRQFVAQVPVSASAGSDRLVSALNLAFEDVAEDIVVWVTGRI